MQRGEREAARWIAQRLRDAGVPEVELEDEPSWGSFPPTVAAVGLLGVVGSAAVLAGRRVAGATLSIASAAALADEVENGPRLVRRALRRRRTTVNVVGRLGDPRAERTLVVLAHHDAAQTGSIFDQRVHIKVEQLWPGLLRRVKTQPPQWWIGMLGAGGRMLGAISRRREPAVAGIAIGLLATALVADIWRSPTVPGGE